MVQYVFFFFNDTATTEIYTLSLHDALPICGGHAAGGDRRRARLRPAPRARAGAARRGGARDPAAVGGARRPTRQHCVCSGAAQLGPWRAGTAARYFTWGSSPAGSCSAGWFPRRFGGFFPQAPPTE